MDIFEEFCCQLNPMMITPQRTEEIQNTLETNDLDEHTELKHTLYFIFIYIILPSHLQRAKARQDGQIMWINKNYRKNKLSYKIYGLTDLLLTEPIDY